MPEFGMAISFTGPHDVDEPKSRMIMNALERNFETTKRMHPEWELPEWSKVEIKKKAVTEAHETLPCEHGDDKGDPLFMECAIEDCEGYVLGPVIPGVFEHAWAWYVNTGQPSQQ